MKPIVERLLEGESGNSAVEFALLAPTMLLLMLGVFDFGMAAYENSRLRSALRIGAQYAIADSDIDAIRQVALDASGYTDGEATIEADVFCECGGTGSSCTAACGATVPQRYVTVSGTVSHTLLMSYPFVESPIVLTGSTTLRLR